MKSALFRRLQSVLGPFTPLLLAYACGALFLSAARLASALAYQGDIAGTPALWRMFPIGLRMDTVLLCYLLLAPGLVLALLPARRWRDGLVAAYLAACAFVLVYLELATPPFIAEYGKRPDRVFLEYLGATRARCCRRCGPTTSSGCSACLWSRGSRPGWRGAPAARRWPLLRRGARRGAR